jgi:hypothetical protein
LVQRQGLRLRMMAATSPEQKFIVGFNGGDLTTLQGSREAMLIEVDIPAEAVAEDNFVTFSLPDARSPKSMGESEDDRILGLAVNWIEFARAPLGIPEAKPVYHPGTRIDLAKAYSRPYLLGNWHGPEEWGQWCGSKASIQFRLEQVQPLRLHLMANTFGKQKVILGFNGRNLKTYQGSAEAELMAVEIPAEAVAKVNHLTFTLPEARSPQSTGESVDERILGLAVAWIEFTLSSPEAN